MIVSRQNSITYTNSSTLSVYADLAILPKTSKLNSVMTDIAYYVEAVFAITLAVLLFGSFAMLIWVIGMIIRDDIKRTKQNMEDKE